MRMLRSVLVAVGGCACAATAAHADGQAEVEVARSSANQLVAHFHQHDPVLMPRSIFPGFDGYATANVHLESIIFDQPDHDLYVPSPLADLRLRLVASSPGVVVYNGLAPLAPGESLVLGQPPFDYHPLFQIPSLATPAGTEFSFRFAIDDVADVHQDSEEFDIVFAPACAADHNLSGDVTVQDLFDFLSDYFAGMAHGDFNRAGGITVQDIFDYLAAYFSPCP